MIITIICRLKFENCYIEQCSISLYLSGGNYSMIEFGNNIQGSIIAKAVTQLCSRVKISWESATPRPL